MFGGLLRCLGTMCCGWPAALMDTELIFVRYAVISRTYRTRPVATLCRSICTPSKAYSAVVQNYTRKTRTGITRKQFFSFIKANTKSSLAFRLHTSFQP